MDLIKQFVLENLNVLTYAHFDMANEEIPAWATALKTWRVRMYGSQPKMEAATNFVLSQIKISRMERGKVHPLDDLNSLEFDALLGVFDWSVLDFQRETGLQVGLATPILMSERLAQANKKRLIDHAAPVGFHLVEVVAASAGMPVTYPVPDSIWRKGARVYKIAGDSMETPSGGLKDGDWVVVDTTQKHVQEGKVYCLEIIGNGHTIKRARKLGGKWWLTSDNSVHKSFQADEAIVIGLVYSRLTSEDVR
jgi:repressor LexA